LILDKSSSILGYPGEEIIPLKTDHRGATKFYGHDDPSYITIRNVLRDLVARFGFTSLLSLNSRSTKSVCTWFTKVILPEHDLEFFNSRRIQGTCKWILSHLMFLLWLEDRSLRPQILWLHGPPSSGKSVLASHVVEYIRDLRGSPCQFFYFRYDDGAKRSTGALLWSLAYQAAGSMPNFVKYLASLGESLGNLEKADGKVV
jgi:hypothetical protein